MTVSESLRSNRIQFAFLLILVSGCYVSIVSYMVRQWYFDENYSHGFFVPFIAAYFLHERREELKEAAVAPWNPGLAFVVLALVQLAFGFLATEYFTMRSSLILLLAGLILFLFGREVFRIARFPVLYLLLMIPVPYIIYDAVAFPLKLFVTRVSVAFLKLIGVVVIREGNIIMFPTTVLEVADACSGIRSLISLFALGVAYAYFIKAGTARRWIIIVSSVPIAIFTNSVRVILTGILAQYWGAKAAEGFFHEFAGLAVFAVAMLMLVVLGSVLRTRE